MFKNKVVLITGGASGIGKATAYKFSELGASVAILDSCEEGESVSQAINKAGGTSLFINCNLMVEDWIRDSIEDVVKQFGRLDYAYNNAGVGGDFAKIENYPVDDWNHVLAINLTAVFLCMKYEIPHILKNRGAIVNCASVLSTVAYENDAAYVASKFGVLGLTKNAALEYANTGMRINAISPGFTRTPMVDKGDEDKLTKIALKHPIGRLAEPEEIAEAVVWLCSNNASFAVGMNLLIDGGYTLV